MYCMNLGIIFKWNILNWFYLIRLCILNMWFIKEFFKCYNIIEILGGLEYLIFN